MLQHMFAQANYTYSSGLSDPSTTQQTVSAGVNIAGILVGLLFVVAVLAIGIIAVWRLFKKAGRPGWTALVPIYNGWVLMEISGKPGWWVFLLFVPIVNIVVSILSAIGLAERFGKTPVFGVFLLWLFSPIGQLILAFDKSVYNAQPAYAPSGQTPGNGGVSPNSNQISEQTQPWNSQAPQSGQNPQSSASPQWPAAAPTGPDFPPQPGDLPENGFRPSTQSSMPGAPSDGPQTPPRPPMPPRNLVQ